MVAMGSARFMGAATACCGPTVAIRPAALLRPCGRDDDDSARRAPTQTACRDMASGLGTAFAPTPVALPVATGCRVLSDLSDAGVRATTPRDRPQRTEAVAVAAGRDLLCGAAGLTATWTR
ncbi:hypothetical protein [Nocardia sp. NPDC002869]|uniref:hypothetical protein n=1 Tax=Nocardia sp. NPDC002869 TaxID=3161032 RepID=UPI00398CA057